MTRDELLDFATTFGATLSDAAGTINFEPFDLERFVAAIVIQCYHAAADSKETP